jgi:hypothetical protein
MTRTGQHQRSVTALALGAIFVIAMIGTPAVQAQTYTVLHRFKGRTGHSLTHAWLGARKAISTALLTAAA